MTLTEPVIDAISAFALYIFSTLCYFYTDVKFRRSFSCRHPCWIVFLLFAASNILALSLFIACRYARLGDDLADDLSLFFCDLWKALSLWGINAIEVHATLYLLYSSRLPFLRAPFIIANTLEAVEMTGSMVCMILMPRLGSTETALLSIPGLSTLPAVGLSALVPATTHLSILAFVVTAIIKSNQLNSKYWPRLLLNLGYMLLIFIASTALILIAHLEIFITSTTIQGGLCIMIILPRVRELYISSVSRPSWSYGCSRIGGPAAHESLKSVVEV